jgi:hypothetical protein
VTQYRAPGRIYIMRWEVLIGGDLSALHRLVESFAENDPTIVQDGNNYVLRHSSFDDLEDAEAVNKKAESIFQLVRGAVQVTWRQSSVLSVMRVVLAREDGSRQDSIFGSDHATGHDSGTRIRKHADGTEEEMLSPLPPAVWTNIALRDASVAEVLDLLSTGQPSWGGLYHIFEVVEQDIGTHIDKKGWASRGDIRAFKYSANEPSVAGIEARHGKKMGQSRADTMALPEAEEFIYRILEGWLRAKIGTS